MNKSKENDTTQLLMRGFIKGIGFAIGAGIVIEIFDMVKGAAGKTVDGSAAQQ